MKNILPIIIIVAAIAGITIYSQSQKTSNTDSKMIEIKEGENQLDTIMEKEDEVIMEKDGEVMVKDESMEKDDSMMIEGEAVIEKKLGSFVKYEDTNIAELDGNIILDFSATWCPSCRTFKKDVEKSLDDIPTDLTLILVDYDSNKDLRRQYSVTQQHTFVQIDNLGNKVNMWTGGSTLESLFPNIK